jgi:hypothetical protein
MNRFALLIFLIALPLAAQSEDLNKKFNIGLGTYALVITNDSDFFDDDRLTGFSVSGLYAVSDMFALRAAYYALEHDDFSSIDDTGFDFVGYIGAGLMSEGFKIYGGGGIYTENWDTPTGDESFNGLQLSGGIGYNWKSVALDFVLSLRQKDDYEDVLAGSGVNIEGAASGSLILSARF